MNTAINTFPNIASGFVNTLLSIKPLANFAKHQARNMIIQRAEKIGVPWRQRVQELKTHDWDKELAEVQ
ncbi:MAG TPA: SAM-dependent methyltransferase, partial [Stenomitos sp.]